MSKAPQQTESAADAPVDDVAGHRNRLRRRLRETGPDSMQDYELLELVLFLAIPRVDVKPLAKRMLREFGSFSDVLGASIARLTTFEGVGETAATNIKIVAASATRMTRSSVAKRQVLSSWSSVIEYCRTAMAFSPIEEFRVIFLDKKNGLIADEVLQSGTVDHTPVYPREVVKRALELSATALILVHNHPSGDPTPSQADIAMTKDLIAISRPLGIAIHDHIIVGREGHASFKGLQLI